MGAQVHSKGYVPSYYSMRDLNEDSNSSSWPLFYGDKTLTNGQYCNGFTSRTISNAYPGYDKDILKEKMLEHEAIFKNQVMELHRLYRIQRDMMDEVRRKEVHKIRSSMEPSCSSSHLGSQVPSENLRKWHITNFPLENSSYTRPSTSGTEIVNSPFSCSKGNGVQSGRVPIQNGYSSKNSDVLEARPSKVRKKLFDLQRPADEYLDDTEEGEQLQDTLGSSFPSFPANGNYPISQERGAKLFLGGASAKIDSQKDTSTSNSRLRSSIGLADLNEPAQVEEATHPVDFLGYDSNNKHKETRSINASANSNSNPPFVALPWSSNCINVDNKGKEREWLASAYETGHNKGSSALFPKSLERERDKIPAASQAQIMINKTYQAPGVHLIHQIKDGIWKDRTGHSLDTSHRNGEQSNYARVEPSVGSRLASPYPCATSSEFSNKWSHSNGSFAQRLSSMHTNSFFNSSVHVGKASQSSQSQMRDYWNVSGSSRLHRGFASEVPVRNGFLHGSSSGTKESPIHLPSDAFDSSNRFKDHCFKSERTSNNKDAPSGKGFNLNVLSESDDIIEPQDSVTVLPWLKPKASGKNGICHTQNGPSALEDRSMKATKEVSETRHVSKILGVPILDIPSGSRNESSSLVSTSATVRSSPERKDIRHERRQLMIDINMAFDVSMVEPENDAEPIVTEKETKTSTVKNHFDLNSCITEDEELVSAESNKAKVKIVLDIDLEAPAVMDDEQDNLQLTDRKPEHAQEELDRIAAEAIVSISSCVSIDETSGDPSDDSLRWFVDVVSSCAAELDTKGKRSVMAACSSFKEIDFFEAMTLQLTETEEEDYMPKPFVPEFLTVEGVAGPSSLTTRPRRGNARRGRQRRDFQRDILPGLVSLSRHEVTEDLQTFGGMMRATGHPWTSGLTRRNGTRNSARGRRKTVVVDPTPPPPPPPLMHQLNNIEASLEDKSLTGWGKTPRRPRRQRCAAGNPPTVLLT